MRITCVRSGGQTGADRTGLECAKAMGLATAGTAPKGYRTETGPDPTLADFGLIESMYADYGRRTRDNVRNAEATIWFGNVGSPGFYCTQKHADQLHRPFYINPSEDALRRIAKQYSDINIAGNRKSKNPGVMKMVQKAFAVWQQMQKEV